MGKKEKYDFRNVNSIISFYNSSYFSKNIVKKCAHNKETT